MNLLQSVDMAGAFGAGFLTFFTPCILPLIPAWLTFISGMSYQELVAGPGHNGSIHLLERFKRSSRLFWPTLFFVLGFGLVFTILGGAFGALGDFFSDYGAVLRYISGGLLIMLALNLLGVWTPDFLSAEKRVHLTKKPAGLLGAFLVGMAFAAGWTPCVGPILASILSLAAAGENIGEGGLLLAVFSLGLGLPFILVSLVWGEALTWLGRIKSVTAWINKVLGVLVLILAIMLITGTIQIDTSGW